MSKIAFWFAVGMGAVTLAAAIIVAKAQIDPTIWYAWILKNSFVVPTLLVVSGLCFLVALRDWQHFRRYCWVVFAWLVPPHKMATEPVPPLQASLPVGLTVPPDAPDLFVNYEKGTLL